MLSKSTTSNKEEKSTCVTKSSFNKIIGSEFKQLPHQLYNTLGYQYSVILSDNPVHIGQVLVWPKSSFKFFRNILKTWTNFLANLICMPILQTTDQKS